MQQNNWDVSTTTDEVKQHNRRLVAGRESDDRRLEQVYRHNRLQKMMEDGAISSDNALYHHLVHFEEERKERMRTDLGNATDTATSGEYNR